MSTKQMTKAALDGRKIEFSLPDDKTVSGDLVGMDDYHWLVDDGAGPALVHKAAAHLISFSWMTLADEDEKTRTEVCKVGQPFWDAIGSER